MQLFAGVLGLVGCACVATAEVQGESRIFPHQLIVRVAGHVDAGAGLDAFISSFEASHPGLALSLLDQVEGRPIFRLAVDPPPAVPPSLDHPELEEIDWVEYLCECDVPEGGTGSTYVDGIEQAAFRGQFLVPQLGLVAAQARSTGVATVVAVLDTGLDAGHAELVGRVLSGGWDFIDDDADPADVGNGTDSDGDGVSDEMVGHGTYVAGLVSLVAPDAKILPVRVLDGNGVGDSWAVMSGVYHAIDRGVEVINLSLRSTLESEAVEEAVAEARNHGIVVAAAAGNFDRSEPAEYPATEDAALGVAALDDTGRKAGFSNFNDDLFISAPGASAALADGSGPDPARSIVSIVPGGGYAIWDGTSMATPLVAGAAALIRAQHPEWRADSDTVELITNALEGTVVDIDAINPEYAGQLGQGRLHAGAAVGLGPVAPRLGDLDGSGVIGMSDLLLLLAAWGEVHTSADLDGNGRVDVADLLVVLANWG